MRSSSKSKPKYDHAPLGEIKRGKSSKLVATRTTIASGKDKGKQFVDVRVYKVGLNEGEPGWVATPSGLMIALDDWPQFLEFVNRLKVE